jgi:hypothetical protein
MVLRLLAGFSVPVNQVMDALCSCCIYGAVAWECGCVEGTVALGSRLLGRLQGAHETVASVRMNAGESLALWNGCRLRIAWGWRRAEVPA